MIPSTSLSRRDFLQGIAAGALGTTLLPRNALAAADGRATDAAAIAITLDLEMSRNFPTPDQTNWDFEKGNLDDATKQYALEAARRVHARGGVIHFFALGRTLEQENVEWLQEIAALGHPIGNHTYDHVNLRATKPEETQFRFRRAPWLLGGKTVREILSENIRLTTAALKSRLGVEVSGFRSPGGFRPGLKDRPDLQALLLEAGFTWVSTQYPAHPTTRPGTPPSADTFKGIIEALASAQPFAYPNGLIEVPMSPISDVAAFRTSQWQLEDYVRAIDAGLSWTIAQRAVFDYLAHPSILCIKDPDFRAIDLICTRIQAAGDRAALTDLGTIARRVRV